jgi:hypothetical protein
MGFEVTISFPEGTEANHKELRRIILGAEN